MSEGADGSAPGGAGVLAEVTEMVRKALLDYGEWSAPITPDARLDADLGMQSLEFSGLQSALVRRWGAAGDLGPLLRTLDLAGLAGLTVAAVAEHVAAGLGAARR